MVIWLIGLSGSGKTTLGREIARLWRKKSPNTVLLDGDEVRQVFAQDQSEADYALSGRRRNAERMTGLCELLDRQGINVVCCILSLFPDMRAENPRRFSRYFEIFMDAPMEVLEQRDVKGLYSAARAGRARHVAGIDLPFPRPECADLVVDTSASTFDLEALAWTALMKAGAL
jgi:adenylylsulfate kinase